MLVVDDLGVLNTHLALSRANRDVVGDKKGGACEDVFSHVKLSAKNGAKLASREREYCTESLCKLRIQQLLRSL